jgi:hypothetical protein
MADGTPSERTPRPDRPKAERRRHPRAMTNFSATVVGAAREWTAKVINLSLGGALLDLGKEATDLPIAVGERLTVTVRSRLGTRPVTVSGAAVLWNTKVGRQPLLAMQFDPVVGPGPDADALDELMDEALSEIRGRMAAGLG